jgi:hypothetical protein
MNELRPRPDGSPIDPSLPTLTRLATTLGAPVAALIE